ncbi:hypothetical protein V8E52_010457 [Russula decolorans]
MLSSELCLCLSSMPFSSALVPSAAGALADVRDRVGSNGHCLTRWNSQLRTVQEACNWNDGGRVTSVPDGGGQCRRC